MATLRAGLAALALAGLAGCAGLPRPAADWAAPSRALPQPRLELSAVPFFPQDDDLCGPAALATALQAAGFTQTPDTLREQVYLPARQGSLQVEMLAAARRAGALPYPLAGTPEGLLREVAAGHPVVVLQDVGALRRQWHYAVVVGYDREDGTLTLRSGTDARRVMDFAAFDRSWAASHRWAFVALPPGRLPATAREADHATAVAALERVSPAAGQAAWRAALDAWPDSLLPRLALGNEAYRARRLEDAAGHYRQATERHPQSADAWNNLAQALHELGRRDEAMEAARRAVALGGPRQAVYAQTLREVEAGP